MTQKEIFSECRRILHSIKDWEFVENKTDFDFLISAFKKAKYYEFKTQGQEIIKIQRIPSQNHGTSCFRIYRTDKSYTDISYTKIFKKNSNLDDILAALRQAIDPIISEFRKSFIPFEHEGTLIEAVEKVDVDHYNLPFNVLASIWIENHGGVEELIKKVNQTDDNSTFTYFTDENLVYDFIQYHHNNTRLRFLPKEINRARK